MMDKSLLLEEQQKRFKHRRCFNVFMPLTLVAMVLLFVLLLATGTLYMHRVQAICHFKVSKPTAGYDVTVQHNKSVSHEHVLVDEVRQTEVVVVRAPETNHISHVATSDFFQRLHAIFNSETDSCYVAHMDDSYPNFRQYVEELKQRNGETVDGQVVGEYTVGEPVLENELIPAELGPFCASGNSYWLKSGKVSENVKRRKRSWDCRWECWYDCSSLTGCRYICGLRCYG